MGDNSIMRSMYTSKPTPDLAKHIAHRPGSLNWVLNPDAPDWSVVGNFRMVRPWNEWVVSVHPSSTDGVASEPDEEAIRKRLYQMIGDSSVSIEILSTFQWTINEKLRDLGRRAVFSALEMPRIVILLSTDWEATLVYQTLSTWLGNWPMCCMHGPAHHF
jgi:hypothetical protein